MQFFLELPIYKFINGREITLNLKVFISYLMHLELSLLQWYFDILISVHGSNLSLASCSSSVYSSVRWMKCWTKKSKIPKYCKKFLKILCLLLTKLLSSNYLIRYSIEVNGKNTIPVIMFTRRLYWSHYLNITVLVLVYNGKKGMNAWSEKV